jgi:adenosylcobinamide-GDP ribazoletransferase
MRKELDIFFTALMFFTRIPVPRRIDHGADLLQKSARYFPWIGLIVGSVAGGVCLLSLQFFSPAVSVFISMLVSIFVTGAFHEDGFADVCDAFGGGWTKEKILMIMKDSRLGTYGVIGLISMLGLKFILLMELLSSLSHWALFFVIVSAHSLSRLAAVTVIQQYRYVTDDEKSKSMPLANRRLLPFEIFIAAMGGFIPLVFIEYRFLIALALIVLSRIYLGRYFFKWIGGYTGDCLGATQQVCEVLFYLGIITVWKFI